MLPPPPFVIRSWYRQAELQNARWAMLGVAGILGQEVLHPEQWWYTAGMPENLPSFDNNKTNLGEWCHDAAPARRGQHAECGTRHEPCLGGNVRGAKWSW